MEYDFQRVGAFWVIYEDDGGCIQREVFSSRDFNEARQVLRELLQDAE